VCFNWTVVASCYSVTSDSREIKPLRTPSVHRSRGIGELQLYVCLSNAETLRRHRYNPPLSSLSPSRGPDEYSRDSELAEHERSPWLFQLFRVFVRSARPSILAFMVMRCTRRPNVSRTAENNRIFRQTEKSRPKNRVTRPNSWTNGNRGRVFSYRAGTAAEFRKVEPFLNDRHL